MNHVAVFGLLLSRGGQAQANIPIDEILWVHEREQVQVKVEAARFFFSSRTATLHACAIDRMSFGVEECQTGFDETFT